MPNRTKLAFVAIVSLAPAIALGQTMDRPKDIEVGDKATFTWVLNNKPHQVEEQWVSMTDNEMQGVQRVDGKEHPVWVSRADFGLLKSICYANGQSCTFSPAVKFVDFPLEKGKKWKTTFTVTGQTFSAQVNSERKVETVEKVKTPLGELEAFRISHKGSIQGRDNTGNNFSGREDGKDWFAVVNGKLVLLKMEYRNSFGEKSSRELVSISSQ